MSFKSNFAIQAVAALGLGYIGGTTPVLADIINVPGDQPTIQAGIDAAMDGDEVVVADGTYIGAGNKNLSFNDRSLILRSANGPANCVIDCEDDGRGFFFVDEIGTIIIEGLTVTRGRVGLDSPGSKRGGAVYCVRSFATFVNCIFDNNHAHAGGAIFVAHPDTGAVFINCQITNQVFDGDGTKEDIHTGGGAFVRSGASADFINCTIADNATTPGNHVGGGIHVRDDGTSVLLANCVLWGNSAGSGDQIGVSLGSTVTVHYSDVQGGEAEVVVVDDDGTLNWGEGNIDADPLFVDPDNGDYRLSLGSPAIDAAQNTAVPKGIDTDLDGYDRFVDTLCTDDTGKGMRPIVDMGPYEFQLFQVTCPWDLDCNGSVGVGDLLIFLAAWGPCPPKEFCPADFDNTGNVGVSDLLVMLANWGPCP